jgi:uncharacterized damage-inducible protein DinB
MDHEYFEFLFKYNYWARDKILKYVRKLSIEQFTNIKNYGLGNISNTLVHILNAEIIWRKRCQEIETSIIYLEYERFQNIDDIEILWKKEELLMLEFITKLSEKDITSVVKYRKKSGVKCQIVLWQILFHIINHGTEHRSNIAEELTEYNYSPGDIDIIHFIR